MKREGVNVPGVLGADWEAGWLILEFVEGRTVRRVLDGWAEGVHAHEGKDSRDNGQGKAKEDAKGGEEEMLDLMRRVGREVGKLHELGVCHGDLTTSNIMLRTPQDASDQSTGVPATTPAIPAGRRTVSALREAALTQVDSQSQNSPTPPSTDPRSPSPSTSLRGDIYLIDFGLTTASIQDEDKAVDLYVLERAFSATHPAAESLFQEVLKAYGESYKGGKGVLKRLEGVRLRGRKRSMLG